MSILRHGSALAQLIPGEPPLHALTTVSGSAPVGLRKRNTHMPKTDIARRVYNHTWKLDPIVRSLLDTDFYKLLMLQMIWGVYRDVDATFSLINRTKSVRLADEIDEQELRAQLDHARTLRFTKKEMIWRVTPFTAASRSSSPTFSFGWKASGFPNTSSPGATASTSFISTAAGTIRPCGRYRRSPSSTNCAAGRR